MGLYEKIFKVMEESTGLEKSMEVGSGSYQYKAISEAEVLNAIKPLFKKHKLIIIPVEVEITEIEERKMTQLKAKYKIIDIETGESEILATVGNGSDSQDKGSGKAWTYAYKALLQKTFMLFSGEDTDNTHSDDIPVGTQSEPEPTKITPKMLIDMAKSKNIDEKGLIAKYKKETGKEITEIKFMAQEYKTKYYNAIKELEAVKDEKA